MKKILENHISFWLNWDVKTLIDRIEGNQKRPLAYKAKDELNEHKNDLLFIPKQCIKLIVKMTKNEDNINLETIKLIVNTKSEKYQLLLD